MNVQIRWCHIRRKIAVLSLPGRNHSNRYFSLFCSSLEETGAEIVNIRDRAARTFRFDILHIHFPTHFVTETKTVAAIIWACSFALFFLLTKLLRKPIVYTVHNVIPFNVHREWLLWPYLALVHRCSDAFVFLNRSSQAAFYVKFPEQKNKPFVTVPLGPYPTVLQSIDRIKKTRNEITDSADAFLIGILGSIKRYKSLDVLRHLPFQLRDGRQLQVVVAGRIEQSYVAEANAILSVLAMSQLKRIDSSLTDSQLDDLIQAVDVVLLPYTRGWNSSAALLALSNRARIIASDLPVFRDLHDALGEPWIRCVDSSEAHVADSFRCILESASSDRITESDEDRLSIFLSKSSFKLGAETIDELYRRLLC